MKTGTAVYEGETVFFSDWIVFNGRAEYLINNPNSYGVAEWVRGECLSAIVYHVRLGA